MNNIFLTSEDSKGTPLRRVTADTGNVIVEDTLIPNNGYSETFSGSDCLEFILLFIFSAAATGTVVIQEVIDPAASVAGETFDTLTVTAERVGRWNAGEVLTGTFRIKNTSGQSVTAYVKKRIN